MNPDELEFLAEKELIGIVPKFSVKEILMLEGSLGPFRAGLPTSVPLWIALHLRQMNQCTIIAPDWMNVQTLENIKTEEKENDLFTKLPSENYMAVTKLIFQACPQDIPDADKVKVLIKDIWDNRTSKLRTAILAFIDKGATFAKVDNLTQMEMATVRPFFPHALEQLHRIRKNARHAVAYAEAAIAASKSLNSSNSASTSSSSSHPGPSDSNP